MYDVTALGELLIDFTYAGKSKDGMKLFEQNPGGAPGNFLTVLAKMGFKTAMLGKVGNDMHGRFLAETIREQGIDADGIIVDDDSFTTLAFVDIADNGERNFSFARKPGADTQLRFDEIDKNVLKNTGIFHIGSLSLTCEPARSATYSAVDMARAYGAIISYDPNYRASLWKNEKTAVKEMKEMLKFADIVKVSDEEAQLLTDEKNISKASDILLGYGPKLLAVTLGADGVLVRTADWDIVVPGFKTEAVDTTGAGDSFWGGFVGSFIKSGKSLEELTQADLEDFARYGNATASLCVQKRGGIPAIPTKEEVEELLEMTVC